MLTHFDHNSVEHWFRRRRRMIKASAFRNILPQAKYIAFAQRIHRPRSGYRILRQQNISLRSGRAASLCRRRRMIKGAALPKHFACGEIHHVLRQQNTSRSRKGTHHTPQAHITAAGSITCPAGANIIEKSTPKRAFVLVDTNGIEPLTLCTSSRCSTS